MNADQDEVSTMNGARSPFDTSQAGCGRKGRRTACDAHRVGGFSPRSLDSKRLSSYIVFHPTSQEAIGFVVQPWGGRHLNSTEVFTMSDLAAVSSSKKSGRKRKCLSCGTQEMGPGRRYCSKECRQQMVWVLSLSTGLLRVFNARYAAFSFNSGAVVLDVLPVWSNEISRFTYKRTNGKRPADDLKTLILRSGGEWYGMIRSRSSKSFASLSLLKKNHDSTITPDSIKPNRRVRPRMSKREKEYMKLLQLTAEELLCDGHAAKIKSSYRKLAKLYHPDVGGDARKFREINEAQHQMLLWAECPQFTSRKALTDCWSYDGATNRWSPPL